MKRIAQDGFATIALDKPQGVFTASSDFPEPYVVLKESDYLKLKYPKGTQHLVYTPGKTYTAPKLLNLLTKLVSHMHLPGIESYYCLGDLYCTKLVYREGRALYLFHRTVLVFK